MAFVKSLLLFHMVSYGFILFLAFIRKQMFYHKEVLNNLSMLKLFSYILVAMRSFFVFV